MWAGARGLRGRSCECCGRCERKGRREHQWLRRGALAMRCSLRASMCLCARGWRIVFAPWCRLVTGRAITLG
eukprot:6195390-Prymnesium_polylepis.1